MPLLALVRGVVGQVVRTPHVAHFLHLADVVAVRLAPALDEVDEAVLKADALVKPYRCAVAVADVPKGIDGHTNNVRDAANSAFLAHRSQLHSVIRALGRDLEGFLDGAGVLLPHLLGVAAKLRITGGNVPVALLAGQNRAGLTLHDGEILAVLVGHDHIGVDLVAWFLPPGVEVDAKVLLRGRGACLGLGNGTHGLIKEVAFLTLGRGLDDANTIQWHGRQ